MKNYFCRDYLEGMVCERTLMSSLVKFSIDNYNSVIEKNHRADVMQIVLRSVFHATLFSQI